MANMFPVSPAPHQDNNQHQQHRPGVVFGHRGPLVNPNRSIHHENVIGNVVGKGLNWAFPHSPTQHFGANMRSLGRDVKSTFNPTTKAGLVNVLSMFAGGPKGEDILGQWQPAGKFEPYSAMHGSPLDRGIAREGTNFANPSDPGRFAARVGQRLRAQSSIGPLVRRAQGVGGYKQANPMDVIEALNNMRSKEAMTRDRIKEFSNRGGARAQAMRSYHAMHDAAEESLGAKLIPFRPKSDYGEFNHTSADFRDRVTLLNLLKTQPNSPFLHDVEANPILQALHDMLFRDFHSPYPKPPRPNSGGYPYGGGPFG